MKRIILSSIVLSIALVGLHSCKEKSSESGTSEIQDAMDAPMETTNFVVDPDTSLILWKGSKPLKSHNGTIKLQSGTIAMNGDKIEAGEFTIDMNSIIDLDLEGDSKTNLENHLKGTVEGKEGDFFNVTKYPVSKFTLTGISEKDGKTMVNGNLTIKDKSNNIEFPATVTVEEDFVKLNSEPFMLDRTKWGVNFGSKSVFDNLGDKFIDDDMEIIINIFAKKS
jgi:polyisoprenoid-binding protein YceI